jgi:hypothetical protein
MLQRRLQTNFSASNMLNLKNILVTLNRHPPSSANELLGFAVGNKKTGQLLQQGEPARSGAKFGELDGSLFQVHSTRFVVY